CRVIRVIGAASRDGKAIRAGTTLKTSTQLTTEAGSFLTLSYPDGSQWELGPKSNAALNGGSFARFNLATGSAILTINPQAKDSPFQLETPHSQVKVLGTQFQLTVNEESTTLEVREGKVRITRKSDGKSLTARARDRAEIGPRIFRKRRMPKAKRSKQQFIFRENFEKRPLKNWPKSFREKNPESSGFVTIQRNKNKFMSCQGSNQIQRAYLPFDKFPAPFTVQFRIRLTGKENSRIGLNLWNETDKQRYAVAYDKQAGLFKVYQGKAGKPLASSSAQLAITQWHDIKVSISKKSIAIFVSDRAVLSVDTPVSLKISAVSIVTLGKDAAEFDNVLYFQSPRK
ncbi:MAG: FecR family protein, partial [Planctomycetota bacterium]|nr:FecR family protein [Planctomycetota bacterium]